MVPLGEGVTNTAPPLEALIETDSEALPLLLEDMLKLLQLVAVED